MHGSIFSAPFGNYLHWPNTTRTYGTFTMNPRPGRIKQILKTVRYYPRAKAWINQIGLRNPGMDHFFHNLPKDLSQSIVSIHGFDLEEWYHLSNICAKFKPLYYEMNLSCPNVIHTVSPQQALKAFLLYQGPNQIIVKLSPVDYETTADIAYNMGIRIFHACNTIPTPTGGISGKPLKPFSIKAIKYLYQRYSDITIIGGGGITTIEDVKDYMKAGANHVSFGSVLMLPWKWPEIRKIVKSIQDASFDLDDHPKSDNLTK